MGYLWSVKVQAYRYKCSWSRIDVRIGGTISGTISATIGGTIGGTIAGTIGGAIGGRIGGTAGGTIGGRIEGTVDGRIGGTVGGRIVQGSAGVAGSLAPVCQSPPLHYTSSSSSGPVSTSLHQTTAINVWVLPGTTSASRDSLATKSLSLTGKSLRKSLSVSLGTTWASLLVSPGRP